MVSAHTDAGAVEFVFADADSFGDEEEVTLTRDDGTILLQGTAAAIRQSKGRKAS